MKFPYKFSNLLGTVYQKGNIVFSNDGSSLMSPVGNKVTVFDLKNNKSVTLPVESSYNYTALDISPNGSLLVAINEAGELNIISLIAHRIIHRYRFKQQCSVVKFSPDGRYFAVGKERNVFIFKVPGLFNGQYNQFMLDRVFHNASEEITCIDWCFNSRVLAAGSKDMTVKLYPLDKWNNFKTYTLGSHTDIIVGCFFENKNLDITTLSRNGQLCLWECSMDIENLEPLTSAPTRKKNRKELEEDDIDSFRIIEKTEQELAVAFPEVAIETDSEKKNTNRIFYKRLVRHYLADEVRKKNKDAVLSASAYHKDKKLLVTGYSTGAFFIYEIPDINIIHSLNVSVQSISAISFNNTGDWIALGCSSLGQLLVWEWQSETYVLKQQGHSNNMSCIYYSADGQLVATGGEDGKLKLWNIYSGFCFVTFHEHSSAVTAVTFGGSRKFVVSASLDGTARAYDIIRYRNFRTFTIPRRVQLSCIAVDSSGEFVASGGQDVFEIFLWSVKTGRLLEILAGHEGPVTSLAFSPLLTSAVMVSASWDKTIRIWDALEKGSTHETIKLSGDGLCIAFKPNGQEIAVSTLDGQISAFNVQQGSQISSIEGRSDLGSGKYETSLINSKKNQQTKAFTSLCYSADGIYLLASGQSKNVCIYNIQESVLVKKFVISQNRSFDAVDDFINKRKLTEFGNKALIEEREGGTVALKLPGVQKGDSSARSIKPEVRVYALQFSPAGQEWAAATTEGLLIYSLNVHSAFDPWGLEFGATPDAVRQTILDANYINALTMAMKINEQTLVQEVLEQVPYQDVELIVSNLSKQYVDRLFFIITNFLEDSCHIEFYLHWIENLLTICGPQMTSNLNIPALNALQKSLTRKYDKLSNLSDFNTYIMHFLTKFGDTNPGNNKKGDANEDGTDDSNDNLFNSDVEV